MTGVGAALVHVVLDDEDPVAVEAQLAAGDGDPLLDLVAAEGQVQVVLQVLLHVVDVGQHHARRDAW